MVPPMAMVISMCVPTPVLQHRPVVAPLSRLGLQVLQLQGLGDIQSPSLVPEGMSTSATQGFLHCREGILSTEEGMSTSRVDHFRGQY